MPGPFLLVGEKDFSQKKDLEPYEEFLLELYGLKGKDFPEQWSTIVTIRLWELSNTERITRPRSHYERSLCNHVGLGEGVFPL